MSATLENARQYNGSTDACSLPGTESITLSATGVSNRMSSVSFQDPPPRPRRSSQRPSPQSISARALSWTQRKTSSDPHINAAAKEMCGYCSDHGEFVNSETPSLIRPTSSRKRIKSSKAAVKTAESSPEAPSDFFGRDDTTYDYMSACIPPDDPEVLLQVAEALEHKARRDLFKAGVLRWRIQTHQLGIPEQIPLPEEMSQEAKELGVNLSAILYNGAGAVLDKITPAFSMSFERGAPHSVPTPLSHTPVTSTAPKRSLLFPTSFPPPSSASTGSGSNDDTQHRSHYPHTLKKRHPEFNRTAWSTPMTISRLSEPMGIDAPGEPKAKRPPFRSFFSTRTSGQIMPFLRRSISVTK